MPDPSPHALARRDVKPHTTNYSPSFFTADHKMSTSEAEPIDSSFENEEAPLRPVAPHANAGGSKGKGKGVAGQKGKDLSSSSTIRASSTTRVRIGQFGPQNQSWREGAKVIRVRVCGHAWARARTCQLLCEFYSCACGHVRTRRN